VAINGQALCDLAAQFLTLAEKKGATIPLMVGHQLTGISLLFTGNIGEGRAHLDRAIALYDPAKHRPLTTRFGQDVGMMMFCRRAQALWLLGYPVAATADTNIALKFAREIGLAVSLMFALSVTSDTHVMSGNYEAAKARDDELLVLAEEKGAPFWKALGMMNQGALFAMIGKTSDAVRAITLGISTYRSTGSTLYMPWYSSILARAYAELGQVDDAWRCVAEAMTAVETTKERWCEAEIHRMAGEIALMQLDAPKAQSFFEQALAVARQQQAKSWELRAAMSLARLWRDQGKPQQARELLAPVYGWFTEGFDTRDLKEAKVLLDELAA
jgi:predicted ATPase